MCACTKPLQLCLTLCEPMGCSLLGSSAHGTLQARKLEWVAISFSRGIFPTQGSEPKSLMSPALAGGFFTTSASWEGLGTKSCNNPGKQKAGSNSSFSGWTIAEGFEGALS